MAIHQNLNPGMRLTVDQLPVRRGGSSRPLKPADEGGAAEPFFDPLARHSGSELVQPPSQTSPTTNRPSVQERKSPVYRYGTAAYGDDRSSQAKDRSGRR
jgi:hypothetical protein